MICLPDEFSIGGWPAFESGTRKVMHLQRDNITVIKDGEVFKLSYTLVDAYIDIRFLTRGHKVFEYPYYSSRVPKVV